MTEENSNTPKRYEHGSSQPYAWGYDYVNEVERVLAVDEDGKLLVGGIAIDVESIEINLEQLEAMIGAINSAMVAAGAEGNITAKLRRVTQDLGEAKVLLQSLQAEGNVKTLNDLNVAIGNVVTAVNAISFDTAGLATTTGQTEIKNAIEAITSVEVSNISTTELEASLDELLEIQQRLFDRQVIIAGADVASSTNTTLTFAAETLDAYADGVLVGESLRIVGGPGNGQTRIITGQTGDIITIDRDWDTNPTSASKASIARCMITKMGEVMENPITEFTQLWRLKQIEDGQKLNSNAVTATIGAGGNVTDPIEIAGALNMSIIGPDDWDVDDGAAEDPVPATLIFEVCNGDTAVPANWRTIYYDDQPLEISSGRVSGGAWLTAEMIVLLCSVQYFRLRSGLAGAEVNQTADREFTINFVR